MNFAPFEGEIDEAIGANNAGQTRESVFVFPATPAQRRFWLLDQLQPGGNPALNLSVALRWHGPLDPGTLRRALNEVVARHEALRTTFESERGQLTQLIAPALTLNLPLLDVRDFPGADRDDLPAQLRQQEASEPLDLRAGPLVRARLLRLAPTEHILFLTVHHIVSDGWSNEVIISDLCALYTAFLQGHSSPLPPLPFQFADYADWQAARLAAHDFAPQRDFWRQKLAGELSGLELPFDRPRRTGKDGSGDVRSRLLPPELVGAATALAAGEGASPFMIFFAVLQVLLHRYTGQVDFLVTSPSANRDRPEFESLVGLFVNPLLLRANLEGNPTFRELLGRVRGVALEAFSNQQIPFESLLDEFKAPRLQVNFHYDAGLARPTILPPGLTLEAVPSVSAGTVYELSTSVLKDAAGFRLEMEYNTSLFDGGTIDRMLAHFETLLRSAVTQPDAAVSALPLLTRAERLQLGLESEAIIPDATTRLDIRAPLVERVMTKPDATAARQGRRELSYAELLARMESARNADKSGRAPSDLEQAAGWVAHWRARVDTPPPPVVARSPEGDACLSSACLALREAAGLLELERMASFSMPGAAATEELGAALLANVLLVYPTPDLFSAPPSALAAWLESENIAVACLPAATWNRLEAAFAARKARKPEKLRLVIATEGQVRDGSFGRVAAEGKNGEGRSVRVCQRTVLEAAGGTIALDGRRLLPAAGRIRVVDPRSGEPMPLGAVGALAVADETRGAIPTGELSRWLPDGSLDRLGQGDEQIYSRGSRLDLRRTESTLCALPGVRHALVRPARPEPGAPLIAYVFPDPKSGPLPDERALRRLLRERELPEQLTPATILSLKDVPLSAIDGQLAHGALPSPPPGLSYSPEPVQPYLGLQLQLIAIWEDVLGVTGIGIQDDFFELGGNSLLAMRMLQRAELACEKTILPAALFRNPTVEQLAGEIAREEIDESPTLLRVNDSGARTPFFYLHGDLSGGGFYSLKLSRALGPDQPFYVLPPQDLRVLPAAPTIEEMAAAHLQALRAVRPKGPYVIGGFCVGGLVALELARQIRAGGDEVEMLLIIDAASENAALRALRRLSAAAGTLLRWDDFTKVARFGAWSIWHRRLMRWYSRNVRRETRLRPLRLYPRFISAFGDLWRRRGFGAKESKPSDEIPKADAERDAPSVFLWASAGYQPQSYAGPVAVLLSKDVLQGAGKVGREWQQLAPEVVVHPLAGSHLECITVHVDTLAQTIDHCLRDAATGSPTSPVDKREHPTEGGSQT